MTGNEVRKKFLDYFEKHNHRIVRSSSLIPADDPTLLFVNAGMVQFKRIFLGEEQRGYARATTSQKCVRAGGKHNDLENVGYTARHHTFFEMLGNFSFGDYFKEKAIDFGWDLLTNGYGLPEDKLWVSIYLDDDEAHKLWHNNIGVPEDRIVRFGEEDNFWAMGDTGPCGPCSEIHIDRGEEFGCGKPDCKVGCDCDRFLEIWNLVFMQFNRDTSGKLTPLPKPSIDTGLGLERMVSIIQDVPTNYDIDLIVPIIQKVEELSQNRLGDSVKADVAMKVVADHSRAAAFLIGDGILPSNEGRGYVLRRIMRRAIRYGRNIGLDRPFLHQTARVVFDIMKPAYPDLSESESFITSVIKNEEVRFSETLDKGLRLLNDNIADLKAKGQNRVPGNLIFKLYDTFGFPVDIVRDVVRDEKMGLDMDGFENAMDAQRKKSRTVTTFTQLDDAYKNLSAQGIIPEFVGYDKTSCSSKVVVMVKDGVEVGEVSRGEPVDIVTEITPFYGESGGQTGDTGVISGPDGEVRVKDTVKDPTGIIIHRCEIISGTIQKGQTVTLKVDNAKRRSTACNHTATHLLHYALRKILGDHVKQAGSLVAPDRFRFDFTHFERTYPKILDEIEVLVNDRIRANCPVQIQEMDAEKAFETGATALFEEKYGDRVRVVSISDFSKELCGGTHIGRTGDIGLFKIIEETSVASGVRRIEAVTGAAAVEYIQEEAGIIRGISELLKERPQILRQRIEKMLAHQKAMEKELAQLKVRMASGSFGATKEKIEKINGINVIVKKVPVDKPAAMRELADRFKDRLKSGIVVLGSTLEKKVLLIVVVSKDLTARFSADKIVKQIASVVGGGGGGRSDMAQAGGSIPEKLDEALEKAREIIRQ